MGRSSRLRKGEEALRMRRKVFDRQAEVGGGFAHPFVERSERGSKADRDRKVERVTASKRKQSRADQLSGYHTVASFQRNRRTVSRQPGVQRRFGSVPFT